MGDAMVFREERTKHIIITIISWWGMCFLNTSATRHAVMFLHTSFTCMLLLPDQQDLPYTNSLIAVTFLVHIMIQQFLGKIRKHCTVTSGFLTSASSTTLPAK